MSKPKTVISSLTPENQLVAQILEEWFGEKCWRFFEDDGIPNTANRSQVRDQNLVAKPADVDKLSLAYQREQPVPGIVVTNDGSKGSPRIVIDGSTRSQGKLQACKVMKWPATIPQFVLNIDPDELDEITEARMRLCGLALNAPHGTPMSIRNISSVLMASLPDESSMSAATLAELARCSPSTVERARQFRRAEARAAELNVDTDGMADSSLVILGQKDQKISNKIFEEVVKLVRQAHLSTAEMRTLFKDLQSSYDDASRMGTIRRWQRECADRIAGRAGRPTDAARLRLLLGQVATIDPKALAESDPALMEGNLDRLLGLRDWADAAVKAAQGTMRARGPVPVVPFTTGR